MRTRTDNDNNYNDDDDNDKKYVDNNNNDNSYDDNQNNNNYNGNKNSLIPIITAIMIKSLDGKNLLILLACWQCFYCKSEIH